MLHVQFAQFQSDLFTRSELYLFLPDEMYVQKF